MLWLLGITFYFVVCVIVSVGIAGITGRNESIVLGILFGPIGMIVAACLGRTPEAEAQHQRETALWREELDRRAAAADGPRAQTVREIEEWKTREELEQFNRWRKESNT